MSARPVSPAMRVALCVALTAWTLLLVVTLLAPSAAGPSWLVETVAAGLERIGVPDSLTDGERVEFALNVVAFVPLSLLGTPLWPRLTWRDWTAAGFAASFLVEAVQAVVFDARSATHADVVANTLGTLVGAVLGLGLAALLASRGPESGSERGADLPDRDASAEELQPPG